MDLGHGLHCFDNLGGAYNPNAYWAETDEGIAIIDTGMPGSEKKMLDQLRTAGKKPNDVAYIILTHPDIDHSGSAAALKQLTGAKIAIHVEDMAKLAGEQPLKTLPLPGRLLLGFGLRVTGYRHTAADIALTNGDAIAGFTVVHTPGHTEGSITLYKKGNVVITGDALLATESGEPATPMKNHTFNMEQALASGKKLAALSFDMLLPGHGTPIRNGADEKVRRFFDKR